MRAISERNERAAGRRDGKTESRNFQLLIISNFSSIRMHDGMRVEFLTRLKEKLTPSIREGFWKRLAVMRADVVCESYTFLLRPNNRPVFRSPQPREYDPSLAFAP